MAEKISVGSWDRAMAGMVETFEDAHPFGRGTITVAGQELEVLVASTPEQRARGMAGRRFSSFSAMLFVWPEETIPIMHNRGVPIALSVAFYNGKGECMERKMMHANDPQRVMPKAPCRYVLESTYDPEAFKKAVSFARIMIPEATLQAQEMGKLPADDVNLRDAEDGAPERCANCEFFLGGTSCELVERAAAELVCDEWTADTGSDAKGKPPVKPHP